MFLEITLTRIFSVTLWYHFAFVVISLAMLGMAAGAMYVYLNRERYRPQDSLSAMGRLTARLATTTVLAYLLSLGVGFRMSAHPAALVSLGLIVGFWAVPFFVSGMLVSIALTRTPLPVGRLYAADLAGAALGCLLVQPALSYVGPPGSIGLSGIALLVAAEWMARGQRGASPRRWWHAMPAIAAIGCFAAISTLAPDLFSPKWVKGEWEPEKPDKIFWNAYSRVAVYSPRSVSLPLGWGMGCRAPALAGGPIHFRLERIDATAATWITQFDGDLAQHEYLAYDVVNLAHHLRKGGSAAAIGVGGGRDILAAIVMGQRRVTGVELNPVFVRLLQHDYAEFSGELARHPKVRLVVAEARNWLERTTERFDIIQISLIDTWAATASGVYSLSENSLYTVEAWRAFLQRLTPRGILSVSRWHYTSATGEGYRLAALAQAALSSMGRREPRRHVALVANRGPDCTQEGQVVNILVSPSPLSIDDCRGIDALASRCGFEVICSPSQPRDFYTDLLEPATSRALQRSYFLDISPPTDDRPFFFHMIRARHTLC